MNGVRRIYVEKKSDYAVKAKELFEEMNNYLNILPNLSLITYLQLLNFYAVALLVKLFTK